MPNLRFQVPPVTSDKENISIYEIQNIVNNVHIFCRYWYRRWRLKQGEKLVSSWSWFVAVNKKQINTRVGFEYKITDE